MLHKLSSTEPLYYFYVVKIKPGTIAYFISLDQYDQDELSRLYKIRWSGDVLEYDCLTHNGEYGFSVYNSPTPNSQPSNVTLEYDEISFNDTTNYYDEPSSNSERRLWLCWRRKFWNTNGATVEYNYVHDNNDLRPLARHRQCRLQHQPQLHCQQSRTRHSV